MKIAVLDCAAECSFKLANGGVMKSAADMAKNFESMDDSTFYHHANESRNDFANWAKEALKDEELAEELQKAKDRKSAQIAAMKRVTFLISELSR